MGTPQLGEVDLRSIFTTANTDRIFGVDPATKNSIVFAPGNPFSQMQTMEPMRTYAIRGKVDFDFDDVLPSNDPVQAMALLAAIREVIDGVAPPPSPDPTQNPDPSPNPSIIFDTSIVATGQGNSVDAADVSLSAFTGDVLSFNADNGSSGLPSLMNLYVGSIDGGNQVALVSFDSRYQGDRFSYLVKAGNHPSITVDTLFIDPSMVFVDGDLVLA